MTSVASCTVDIQPVLASLSGDANAASPGERAIHVVLVVLPYAITLLFTMTAKLIATKFLRHSAVRQPLVHSYRAPG